MYLRRIRINFSDIALALIYWESYSSQNSIIHMRRHRNKNEQAPQILQSERERILCTD